MTACSLIRPTPDQGASEPCRLPERPGLESHKVVNAPVDGDMWVAYHPDAHEKVLVYIQELENAAKQCGGIQSGD